MVALRNPAHGDAPLQSRGRASTIEEARFNNLPVGNAFLRFTS
jgi:hypothetical protein